MRRRGLTLVEMLVVIAIIAILAAVLLPVLFRAKRSSQQSACASNLKQIGAAIGLYMADYDDRWPLGIDPADKFTPHIWAHEREFYNRIPSLPLMHELLMDYAPDKRVWQCPSDAGQILDDVSFQNLPASPSSYEVYGTSYYYRTELTARKLLGTSINSIADVNVYFDGSGAWHTSEDILRDTDSMQDVMEKLKNFRYNVLFGDLHVKNVTRAQYDAAWRQPL